MDFSVANAAGLQSYQATTATEAEDIIGALCDGTIRPGTGAEQ